jgi:rSAM/selenodomain-associated transferase 1
VSDVTLVVLAKAPRAGHVKTRLCPPCTPAEAAALAAAALRDTLAAVAGAPAARRLLVLEGEPGAWLPRGFDIVPQCDGDLGRRLAGAFDAVSGPAVLVGMDTPQMTAADLTQATDALQRPGVDAVLGPASDGGYWSIGLRRASPSLFDGVPMSCAATLMAQRRRLTELGLRYIELPELRDVDTIADAHAVAAQSPGSAFARELSSLQPVAA